MSELLHLFEIDQFEKAASIEEDSITPEVIEGVRDLDEIRELEPALRQILYDPNTTPHGPTEIADILTSRVVARGSKRFAGFILKGKSYPKVKSRDVAHQYAKLRMVPELDLAVLVAVGNIQDDAHRDFVQMAHDAQADYLILDAVDCARLLIAYEKICPRDGTPFDTEGKCRRGHEQGLGTSLKLTVSGDLYFEVAKLSDVSHAGAKRYSAVVMVDRHSSRATLREIARRCTPEIGDAEYHRSELVRDRWEGTRAHVVWLFLAGTLEDVRNSNWLARTEWIDPELDPDFSPVPMTGDESSDGISIVWNPQYEAMRSFYSNHTAPKGEMLASLRQLTDKCRELGTSCADILTAFDRGSIDGVELDSQIKVLAGEIDQATGLGGNLPFPPEDLKELDSAAQNLIASLGNIGVYYSDLGLEKWEAEDRRSLLRMALDDFAEDWEKVNQALDGLR